MNNHHQSDQVEGDQLIDEPVDVRLSRLESIVGRIEDLLSRTNQPLPAKEYFTTAEVAQILKKRPFTVREWCRLGRVVAVKSKAGRGMDAEWRISKTELDRIQNDGLLPVISRWQTSNRRRSQLKGGAPTTPQPFSE